MIPIATFGRNIPLTFWWIPLLQRNRLEEAVEKIGEALKVNNALRTLDLGVSPIISVEFRTFFYLQQQTWDMDHEEKATETIAEALKSNNTLTALHLDVRFDLKHVYSQIHHSQHNSIQPEGAEKIADALKVNNILTTMDLRVRPPFLYPKQLAHRFTGK